MSKVRNNPWGNVIKELWLRVVNTFNSIPFIAFFCAGILFVGGVGIWLPYLSAIISGEKNASFLESANVFTYSFAILGTLCVDIILNNQRTTKDFLSLGIIFGVIALSCCVVGYLTTKTGSSILLNLGTLLTLVIFICANVNDEKFDNNTSQPDLGPTGYREADVSKIKDGEGHE
ncbi:hypothetical protein RBA25_003298 [Cronobacter turicensis]|nr:hypothetical protein [Cronobacter turicensis]EKY1943855.1 hypothetical protein [Cronobacter turicensis]EKY1992720.1 hypothetical protein [Cronobacter turicensis]EKY3179194.1 hypothetical protein [Cronobacter turicensis]